MSKYCFAIPMTTHDFNQQVNLAIGSKVRGVEDVVRGILNAKEEAERIIDVESEA